MGLENSCAATTETQPALFEMIEMRVRSEMPPPRPKQSWKLPREAEDAMARQYGFHDLGKVTIWGEFIGPKSYGRDWNELE